MSESLTVRDGHVLLTDKEETYLLHRYGEGLTQKESALLAGYAPKSAEKSAARIDKKLKNLPAEALKSVAVKLGVNPAQALSVYRRVADGEDENLALKAADRILALFGHSTTSREAQSNQSFNIKGPTQIVIKGETTESIGKKLSQLAEPILPEPVKTA